VALGQLRMSRAPSRPRPARGRGASAIDTVLLRVTLEGAPAALTRAQISAAYFGA